MSTELKADPYERRPITRPEYVGKQRRLARFIRRNFYHFGALEIDNQEPTPGNDCVETGALLPSQYQKIKQPPMPGDMLCMGDFIG